MQFQGLRLSEPSRWLETWLQAMWRLVCLYFIFIPAPKRVVACQDSPGVVLDSNFCMPNPAKTQKLHLIF